MFGKLMKLVSCFVLQVGIKGMGGKNNKKNISLIFVLCQSNVMARCQQDNHIYMIYIYIIAGI